MSNPRLDHFSDAIAASRHEAPLAALDGLETQLIEAAFAVAPELDRKTVGAAWLLAGNLLGSFAMQQPAENAAATIGALVNVTRMAGQRLYSGAGLPREVRCPVPYSTGARCKFVAKGVHDSVIDAQMLGHIATYHPGAQWPPEPVDAATGRPGGDAELCSCGAPAAMEVGYRGERQVVAQCVRCAVEDPRAPFLHRDLGQESA